MSKNPEEILAFVVEAAEDKKAADIVSLEFERRIPDCRLFRYLSREFGNASASDCRRS